MAKTRPGKANYSQLFCGFGGLLERFRAKCTSVRPLKTRQNKSLERENDSIKSYRALGPEFGLNQIVGRPLVARLSRSFEQRISGFWFN